MFDEGDLNEEEVKTIKKIADIDLIKAKDENEEENLIKI